jgi:hypothetical protein
MPESFLVRAKDKSGNPVMMVVNPDSVTAIIEIGHDNKSATTGSASGAGRKPTTSQSGSSK